MFLGRDINCVGWTKAREYSKTFSIVFVHFIHYITFTRGTSILSGVFWEITILKISENSQEISVGKLIFRKIRSVSRKVSAEGCVFVTSKTSIKNSVANGFLKFASTTSNTDLFKVRIEILQKRCEICSKLIIKTSKLRH